MDEVKDYQGVRLSGDARRKLEVIARSEKRSMKAQAEVLIDKAYDELQATHRTTDRASSDYQTDSQEA